MFWQKTIRRRRLEVRRSPRTSPSRWERFRRAGGLPALAVAAGLYVCVLLMDIWPIEPLPYREGQYIARDIYARVSFRVASDELIRDARKDARDRTPAVFQLNPQPVADVIGGLRNLQQSMKSAALTQPSDIPDAIKKQFLIDAASLSAWQACAEGEGAARFERQLQQLRQELIERPIVNDDEQAQQDDRLAAKVVLVHDGREDAVSKLLLVRRGLLADSSTGGKLCGEMAQVFDPAVRAGVANYLRAALTKPTYTYDEARSEHDVAAALAAIDANPPEEVFKVYPRGTLLIEAPGSLTAQGLDVLRREHEAYQAAQFRTAPWRLWWLAAGRGGVLLLVIGLLSLYVARYDEDIVRHWPRAVAIAVLLLLVLALHKSILFTVWSDRVAVLTVMLAAFVLAIAYSQRFAIIVCAILALLTVMQFRGVQWQLIVLVAAAAATAIQVRDIRSRSRLIRIGAVSAGVVFLTVWCTGAAAAMPPVAALQDSLWAAGLALLAGFLIQGVLPVVEWAFGVVTDLTLLEWCDASKPLLKRLAMEAPGTFNHSLQLGAICETAAESIGARGLLARVGAYYHDIGKIQKPDYFVENQFGSLSRHAKLSPAMSLLIITGHVKDGLEIAREYGLPKVLHEFIATHHGTTLVQYFYQAAAEQRKAESERAPDEVQFRYPGPKPHLPEAAILMLADAAESSVRSMSDPTPGRIENQVHTMVTRRLMDGQLDDCDSTLRQVHQVEASLTKSLIGIYHARIAYPTPAGERPSAAELPPAKPQDAQPTTKAQ